MRRFVHTFIGQVSLLTSLCLFSMLSRHGCAILYHKQECVFECFNKDLGKIRINTQFMCRCHLISNSRNRFVANTNSFVFVFVSGMYTEATSNGVMVDVTPPIFSKQLSVSPVGTIVPGSIIVRTALKVYWEVTDPDSSIETQHLSMSSHIGGDFNESSFLVC